MKFKMLVVQGRPPGKILVFPIGEYYFGRGKECHVRPNSEWVSRQHCLLRVTPTVVYLRDLGSRNGTLVNGVLLAINEERPLQHGDRVQLGQLVFELQLEGDAPTQLGDLSATLNTPAPESAEAPPSLESTENLPILRTESQRKKG
jgi:pSer/pThr/pTyr-binding forkhead associated (FHA) protein